MSEKILPFHTKPIYYCLFFLAAFGCSIWLVLTITSYQMNYLSYLLYDKSHLSAVYRLLNQFVLRKLLVSVVLFLFALVMAYVFYFSYYQTIYLKLGLLCVCCISYCITLAETDTIFFIGTANAQFWNNASLVATLFLVMMIYQLAFDWIIERTSLFLGAGITAFYLILAGFISSRRFSSNVDLMPFFYLSLVFVYLVLAVMTALQREWKELLFSLPAFLGCAWILYSNYAYRLHNYSIPVLNRRMDNYNHSLSVAVITTFWILGSTLIRKRNLLMHSRELNRKIQDLENAKHMLLGVLYSNVRNSIFSANTALDALQNTPVSSDKDNRQNLQQIHTELTNISALYNQIHNYTIFSGNSMDLYLIRINMGIFFKLFSQRLEYSGQLTSRDVIKLSEPKCSEIYVNLYPEHILQALEDLMALIRQKNPEGHFSISCSVEEPEVFLSLSFTAPNTPVLKPRHKYTPFLQVENPAVPDPTTLDFSISLLRHQVSSCGGHILVSSGSDFRLKIAFPIISHKAAAYKQTTFQCEKKEAKHLLVLTSDEKQMNILKKLLPFDSCHITLANDGDYFMAHPQELEQFSLLIVGNLYRLTYFRDFYNQVRRDYAMTALPILMLLPDLYSENSFYIRNTINDYLIPPYSQASVSKKIHSLLKVKETADVALETQMEFWQSQINPHFIFNSINSIMHLCIREPMTAYELLGDFSEYLRGHLLSRSLERQSTIQKEIRLIQAYLQIEKARFGDKINYEMDIDCDENFPILPLLIEPLIENSIKHSPMHESSVTVNVHIYQQDDLLLVRVEDNGNGMLPETVQAILSNTYESNSIGLSNLCSRLRHYYHTAPSIESVPGEGTVVEFTIQRRTLHDTGDHYR